MKQGIYKQEITPIAAADCFVVFERVKTEFDFPVHYHNEFELTCIKHASELTRYVGDHVSCANEWDLVMVGPNLTHGWLHEKPLTGVVYEKTLQFHGDLFCGSLLEKNALSDLNAFLHLAKRGILFSMQTSIFVFDLLHQLAKSKGLNSFILLQQILQELMSDKGKQTLSSQDLKSTENHENNKLYSYIKQNYSKQIKLEDIAEHFSMSISSFNRMMKKETGNTFVTFVNEYRLGMVARKLLETDYSIEYIAQSCGFINISNFNKFFKKVYSCTPFQYRETYMGTTTVR